MEEKKVETVAPGVWTVAWTTLIGGLGVLFATTTVAVAMQPLAGILDVPLSTIQWISTGYLLALAVAIPIVPWAQQRFGGRRLWLVGLTLFLIASVLSAFAWNAASLIAFRVLQGVAGGVLMPLMVTLVIQAAGGKGLPRVMAVVSVPAVLGPILGPVIGGLVLDTLDWHWLFLVTVPFSLVGLILAILHLPDDAPARRPASLDFVGFVLMAAGLAAVLFGLSNASKDAGFLHPDVLIPAIGGALAIGGFAWWTARRPGRELVDLALLKHRALGSSTLLLFLSGVALYGAMLLIPLYFQQLRGMSPLTAGLLLIPQGVGSLASRTLAARLSERIGARWVVAVGFAIVAVGTTPFLMATEETSLALISTFLLIRGIGLGAVTVPLMALAFEGLANDEVPHASVISRIGQQLGGSFGTAVLAVILQTAIMGAAAPALGFQTAFWWATGLTVAAVALSFLLPGGKAPTDAEEEEETVEAAATSS